MEFFDGGGDFMEISLSAKIRILKQFDSYIKTCCVNELNNMRKIEKRIRKREILSSDFLEIESKILNDSSGIKIFDFIIKGNEIFIEDAILLSALCSINKQEQELILLKYFIGYSDEELSKEMNIPRRTITYRKSKIIKKIKNYMEDQK
jgi:RNA polymerase sigma factor (sigma-70 family)